jgi:pimeloyl-ACP methyl ester carboxylesterase
MEKAIIFGKFDHLLGVENISQSSPLSNTMVIMMSAGMLHNVGPYRMYVELARGLSQQGISSLRFDLSGIGDSLGVGSAGKSIDRAAAEAIEAMDYLQQKHGVKNFIFFGLCSGADDSMQTALQDQRVKGFILMDGLAYGTLKFKVFKVALMLKKMLRPEKWFNKFKKVTALKQAPASLATGGDIREFPTTVTQATEELQQLVDRGTQLHFVYTGGTDYYNYSQQFYDMLPDVNWKGTESTQFFPHMDHVATLCEDRRELINHVVEKVLDMVSVKS